MMYDELEENEDELAFDLNEDMESYYEYNLLDLLEEINSNSEENPGLYKELMGKLL